MIKNLGSAWKPAIAAVALAFAFGCSPTETKTPEKTPEGSTPATTTAATTRPEPTGEGVTVTGDVIKVGVVGSITGDQKPWGDDSIEGAKMAAEEFNAAGGVNGKKVELVIGDSASKAEQAKTATEKLLSEGVVGIVGEVASGNTIQIAKAAFGKAVPVVAIGATRTDLTDEGTHVVRVCYTDAFQGPVMATFAFEDLGKRKVGIITDNKAPYSQGLSKSFGEKFKALGGEIVGEVFYETGQTDFTGPINEIKGKNPDVLFLSGYFPEVGPMAQAIRAAGIGKDVPLLGGDGWDSPQLLVSGGDAILGSYMCNHYNNKETRPEVTEFLTKWKAKHNGKEPGTTMAALGYDAAMLMFDGLKRAKNLNSKDLIASLNDTEGFKGVSGVVNLKGKGGNPDKQALVVEIAPAAQGFQVFKKAFSPSDIK
jgi:branched-chain amino acid transport system substrate-binding protein